MQQNVVNIREGGYEQGEITSEENSLRKFIQTSYIKQIHQNSEYLLDKCYIFFSNFLI